eukprot:752073-Hanusia_phi.AAC.6
MNFGAFILESPNLRRLSGFANNLTVIIKLSMPFLVADGRISGRSLLHDQRVQPESLYLSSNSGNGWDAHLSGVVAMPFGFLHHRKVDHGSLQTCEFCTGMTTFCVRAEDSGYQPPFDLSAACKVCDGNLTSNATCCYQKEMQLFRRQMCGHLRGTCRLKAWCQTIRIASPFDVFVLEGFRLSWNVTCNTVDIQSADCVCPQYPHIPMQSNLSMITDGSLNASACTSLVGPRGSGNFVQVRVVEDGGLYKISSFASSIGAAEGYTEPTETIITASSQSSFLNGDLQYLQSLPDNTFLTAGLEFASSRAQSPSGGRSLSQCAELNFTVRLFYLPRARNQHRISMERYGGWNTVRGQTFTE